MIIVRLRVEQNKTNTPIPSHIQKTANGSSALVATEHGERQSSTTPEMRLATSLAPRHTRQVPKPEWHAPWKLIRVISGHMGWVRSIPVDVSNEWFATGAGDRVIKVCDYFCYFVMNDLPCVEIKGQ